VLNQSEFDQLPEHEQGLEQVQGPQKL